MPIPANAQLAAARRQAEKLLTSTCTITPKTEAVSASGATTKSSGAPITDVPCLVYIQAARNIPSGRNMNVGGREGEIESHVLRVAYNTDINVGDTVTVGADTFEVDATADSDTNRVLLQVGIKRVK